MGTTPPPPETPKSPEQTGLSTWREVTTLTDVLPPPSFVTQRPKPSMWQKKGHCFCWQIWVKNLGEDTGFQVRTSGQGWALEAGTEGASWTCLPQLLARMITSQFCRWWWGLPLGGLVLGKRLILEPGKNNGKSFPMTFISPSWDPTVPVTSGVRG